MIGRFCSRMGLVLALGSSLLFAEQATSNSQPRDVHAKATAKGAVRGRSHAHRSRTTAAPTKIPVQVVTGGTVRTEMFDVQPAGGKQETPGRTTVEEINGAQTSTRVFQTPPTQEGAAHGRASRASKSASTQPAIESVEIINGRKSHTATFEASEAQPPTHQRVVTGIESTWMRAGLEKSPPVVVDVSSSEQDNASGNAQPVVVAVASSGVESDRPVADEAPPAPRHSKRHPYVPSPQNP